MVSTIRYRSFKKLDLRSRRSYVTVVGIALALLVIAYHPSAILLAAGTAYWLSGPAVYLFGLLRRKPGPPPAPVAADVSL
jgi:phosphatidylserine synthase